KAVASIFPGSRIIHSDFIAWIGHVDPRFNQIGITVVAFVKCVRVIDLYVYDIVALRHASDVDPLSAQLLEVPIRPAAGDPLVGAYVAMALVVIVVLQQVFQAKSLLMSERRQAAIKIAQLVVGKSQDV